MAISIWFTAQYSAFRGNWKNCYVT